MYFMYDKLKFLHRKTQSVFFFKFLMIRLLSRHHPAANPSPPFPLCPAAGQRGRGAEGLAKAQLPHIFQDGVSPFAPGLWLGRYNHWQRSSANLPYMGIGPGKIEQKR